MRPTLCLLQVITARIKHRSEPLCLDQKLVDNKLCHSLNGSLGELRHGFGIALFAFLCVSIAYGLIFEVHKAPGLGRGPAIMFLWTAKPRKAFDLQVALAVLSLSEWPLFRNAPSSDIFLSHGILNYLHKAT